MEVVILLKMANSNQRKVIYDKRYLAPCIQAAIGMGGNQQPFVLVIR